MSDLGSNIDKLFKDGLGDAKVNPPSSVFNSIQEQINPQLSQTVGTGSKIAAKAVGVTGVKVAVIATVVTAAVASIVWYNQSESNKAIDGAQSTVTVKNQTITEKENLTPTTSANSTSNEEDLSDDNSVEETILYTQSNTQLSDVQPDNALIEIDEEEPVERIYLEERPEEFVENPEKEQKPNEQETFVLTDCDLVGIELTIQEQTGIINLVNVSNGREDLPIEINWGDSETSRLVLGYQSETRHNYYVINSNRFSVDIQAIGKNCVQNITREVLIKNNTIQQEIIVPNIFTPNNDGLNDSFYVEMPAPKDFLMRVISPMKQIVYESSNWKGKWSGDFRDRKCEKGLYTVILKYKYSGDKELKSKTSTVWLNRN